MINANARFINAKTVEAGEYRITAKYIVLATGSRARILPLTGLSEIDYLTNETIFDLTELPQHVVIVGAGPIGCELAQSYALLGSQVTLLEAASEILSPADSDCKAIVMDEFIKLGIDVMTNVKIQSFSQDNNEIEYIGGVIL